MYLFPEIHKPENPGKLIVSACGCPSELISNFHDRVMVPFDKDTILFQGYQICSPNIKEHSFSWHSEILLHHVRQILIYTVIVHQEGLRALKFIVNTPPNQVQSTAVLV
jgi:hypothetical protein